MVGIFLHLSERERNRRVARLACAMIRTLSWTVPALQKIVLGYEAEEGEMGVACSTHW
jgi:hypothetical protein